MGRKKIPRHEFKPETPTVKVTQLEAAVRQLVQAIRLYFYDGDSVSVHSLARNAEEILSMILKTKGKMSMWTAMVHMVKEERKDEFQEMINAPRNAFKHRVGDENEFIEFPAEMNEQVLFVGVQAIHMYWPDTFKKNPELFLLETWYVIHHPDIISENVPDERKGDVEKLKSLAPALSGKISKKEYFEVSYAQVTQTLRRVK